MRSLQPGALPTPATSFIGRREELAAVLQDLGRERLLTLVGPAGSGKTRLAVEAARAVGAPVRFVDLAATTDVAGAVAEVVGTAQGSTIDEVVAALEEWDGLLVLDNCEHVIEDAAELAARSLAAGVRARILATSRMQLGIAGERLMRVPPLPVPKDPGEVARSDAGALFVDRARRLNPSFEVSETNAPALARLCAALDGLPLAIELAAARANVLSVAEIADRLSDRFALLETTARDVPPRHRTLSAALTWSVELLSPEERTLLSELSVFAAPFDLDAVEAVTSAGTAAVSLLGVLVEQSLVVADTSGRRARYRLLESVRELARTLPEVAGRLEELERRHLEHYLAIARAHADPQTAEDPIRSREIILRAREGIDHALSRALEQGRAPELGAQLCLAMQDRWEVLGAYAAGRRWTDRALEAVGDEPGSVRAALLRWASHWAATQGRIEDARRLGNEALAAAEATGDDEQRWEGLSMVGWNEWRGADYERAADLLGRALQIARALDDPIKVARNVEALSWVERRRNRLEQAIAYKDEALAMHRRVGNDIQLAWGLVGAANLIGSVQPHVARRYLEEAADLARRRGEDTTSANITTLLGNHARRAGDRERARALYLEAVELARAAEADAIEGWTLCMLGQLSLEDGEPDEADRWFAASVETFRKLGEARALNDLLVYRADVERSRGEVRAAAEGYNEALRLSVRVPTARRIPLWRLALMAAERGSHERAARLFGAAWPEGAAAAPMSVHVLRPEDREPTRSALGEQVYAEHAAEGAALDEDAVLAEAAGALIDLGEAPEEPAAPQGATFRRDGDVWSLSYAGASAVVRDSKGMRFLAELLRDPGREIHVSDLIARVEGTPRAPEGDAGALLDEQARKTYRARLAELESEIEEATAWDDSARAEKARSERDAIVRQLSAAYGIGGAPRRAGDPVERMRKVVWSRVRDAIGRIEAQLPALAKHLETSVRTGTYCVYAPEAAPAWTF